MTERSHKPERKDADAVRDKYNYKPDGEEDGGTSKGTGGYSTAPEEDAPTFFTDSGETPDVLAESLEDKDPSKLEALAKGTRQVAEEVEEVGVTIARKEYLAQELSEEALEEDEQEKTEATETPQEPGAFVEGVDADLDSMREGLESRIQELEEAVEDDEHLSEAREMKRRSEAASDSPVISLSDYAFETTRYFNVVEKRLSEIGFEIDIDGKTVELKPGGWTVERDDDSGILTAKTKAGGWTSKKTVKAQVQTHPSPDDFDRGNVVMGYDTDLEETVTRFMREDIDEDYFVLVVAVPAPVEELPDEALDRVEEFVDTRKSLVVVGTEDAEVVRNGSDEVAQRLSRKEILNPKTHEAEVSRLSNSFEDGMVSGDELTASEAAEKHGVSERVATRAFSDTVESHSEFSVLTERVPEPILVRW